MRIVTVCLVGFSWAICALFHGPLSAQAATWTQAAAEAPSSRALAAMAYDSARGRTVLFGGSASVGVNHPRDTWEWDGSAWTRMSISGPSERIGAAMAYDSVRGRTVLFGGFDPVSGVEVGDTWEWDGSVWTQVNLPGPSPAARYLPAMAYDSVRGTTVLFGGLDFGAGVNFRDTWEWDGSAWTQVSSASGPSSRPKPLPFGRVTPPAK